MLRPTALMPPVIEIVALWKVALSMTSENFRVIVDGFKMTAPIREGEALSGVLVHCEFAVPGVPPLEFTDALQFEAPLHSRCGLSISRVHPPPAFAAS